jgi:hypothetical protein
MESDNRKFIIKSILNNNYFHKIHKIVEDLYIEHIYDKDELKIKKNERNNKRMGKKIRNDLKSYQHYVNKCFIEQSRYKDIVLDVYSCKRNIEIDCASKYINDITNITGMYEKHIFDEIIYTYSRTSNTIYGYGGETRGSDDQTLRKAIKILLKNPYLNEDIKNSQNYKHYYNKFINIDDEENNSYYSSDDDIEYNDNEKDVESITSDIELSDVNNEDED